MNRRKFLKSLPPLLTLAGCGGNITGPSGAPSFDAWSPYLGIHPFAWHQDIQQPHLRPLLAQGHVKGIRVDANAAGGACARWAVENGARDVLAVFPNQDLRNRNIEELFDHYVSLIPDAGYWEIGNEIESLSVPPMEPAEYMPIFAKVHRYASVSYPHLVIIPYAPIGGGSGSASIETMMKLGLNSMAARGQIRVIALHVYTASMIFYSQIKKEIEKLPSSVQIWVTETGVDNWRAQVSYVSDMYPKIRRSFRANRIYWYVFAECTGFSLVKGLPPVCSEEVKYSPLYQKLTGILDPRMVGL